MLINIIGNKSIEIEVLNSRVLSLNLNGIIPTEKRENYQLEGRTFYTDKILGLDFYSKKSINIGEVLTINSIKYEIQFIEYGPDDNYLLIGTRLNKSTQFILPLCATEGLYANNYLIYSCLYNTYLKLESHPQYSDNNFLFLKYKFYNITNYKELEHNLTKQPNFIEIIEIDSVYTIFVLEIDPTFKDDINKILNGKYHLISNKARNKIFDFYNPAQENNSINKGMYNMVKGIINRDPILVKQLERRLDVILPPDVGVEDKPNINDETLKI